MSTYQTRFLSELEAGHDGTAIPLAKRAYFQERFRGIMFDFIINKFLSEAHKGLTKAKLSRRIGKAPEIINRLLGAPSNMTIDTISDLLLGIAAEELVPQSASLLRRPPVNYSHTDHLADEQFPQQQGGVSSARNSMFSAQARTFSESAKKATEKDEQESQRRSALCV